VSRIQALRTGLLAHRYLYYVRSASLIADFEYDKREAELKKLVAENEDEARLTKYAAICPSNTVGSSSRHDYPIEIEVLAERLLAYADNLNGNEEREQAPL
jgi:NAD-dependent DNA ligase